MRAMLYRNLLLIKRIWYMVPISVLVVQAFLL